MSLDQSDDLTQVTPPGGIEGVDAILVVQPGICTGFQQHFEHLGLTLASRDDERGVAGGILRIDRSATVQQDAHYRRITSDPRLYRTDKATLQFLSKAQRLRLRLEGDDDSRPFEVWTDDRKALGQFAAN